jgi:hypothetical protein
MDINSPLGRYKMAQQQAAQGGQRPVYVVDEEEDYEGGYERQEAPPQRRRARRRAALSAEEAEQFTNETFAQDYHPEQYGSPVAGPQMNYPQPGPSAYYGGRQVPAQNPSYQDIERMHQEARSFVDKVSPEAKRRIEVLSGLGRISDDVEVDGVKFTFQSIKTNERRDVYKALFSGEDETKLSLSYKNRVQILARALTHIDEQPADLMLGSESIEAKLYLFGELDDHVTDYLYKWYRKNIEEIGEGKYSLTPDEVKEIGEELKKS